MGSFGDQGGDFPFWGQRRGVEERRRGEQAGERGSNQDENEKLKLACSMI